MVLPETDLAGARLLTERLRKAIAAKPILLPTGSVSLTCSMGMAQRTIPDLEAGHLLARADAALYRAKAQGRNRVCED